MASVLDLVKHYQHTIEKYPSDEQKILKSIDKLFHLDVRVQHLQETGVGRTVNALRKEPGDVGQAARALVYKWKLMVAAEESDEESDHNDTTTHNGHGSGKDSDDNMKQSRTREYHDEGNSSKIQLNDRKQHREINGDYSGSKRKYHSSEEEEPDTKKSKDSKYHKNDNHKSNSIVKVKSEPESSDNQDSDNSHSDDSESEMSESTEEELEVKKEIKTEPTDYHKASSSKHSSRSKHDNHKKESRSKHSRDSEKSSKHKDDKSESKDRNQSDKSSSKEKSQSTHKNSKETSSERKHKSDHKSSEKDKKQKIDSRSNKHSTPEEHKSSSQNTKSSSDRHKADKHSSKSEKHSSSSQSHKSDKEKHKSSSEKEITNDKHKTKDSSSSTKDKSSSSTKEKSKERSSSSKEKSDSSNHKNEKKHSSKESKSKSSDKNKSDKIDDKNSESKSKHKSSSSSSHKNKSGSSQSKEEIPKKKQVSQSEDSEDGIDCGSGASFAEALGMISPAKPKKKTAALKDSVSPNNTFNNDLSPAALLAPTAKLAPLPALEISALPEISPNYKPRPPPKLLPHFTDEEAMSAVISSKNQRTKVYSGNKVMGKIPTLYEMCVHILQEHIDALEYTGGVPYEILKPVVDKATPQQLFTLEHFNPYLMEDTDHLWQKFCEKHFRRQQRQELETWREMYIRCQEEQEYKLKSLTENIKIAQEAKKAPIKQTKMAYVDTVVKPPRNIARKQALHGTAHAAAASPAARVAALASAPNILRGSARPSPSTPVSSSATFKPKKAPLMQKALQFMRGRKR